MVPEEAIAHRGDAQSRAASEVGASVDDRIMYGDLHVHTTLSSDAFMWALPILGGEGAHPLADACDFARYCSQLDFFAATDHAESLTPARWRETRESIRQCNAVTGAASQSPDMVAFIGFEWTQVGDTPDTHYGHKNVIFPGLEDEGIAQRAIAASGASMPDMDGIEVLNKINTTWPDTKVVMVTGYSTVETAVQALRLGAYNFIEKPFTPDTLIEAVKEVFEKSQGPQDADKDR